MTDWGLLELSCDGIVLLDESKVVTAANARALEFLRCLLPAVAGRDFWQVVCRRGSTRAPCSRP